MINSEPKKIKEKKNSIKKPQTPLENNTSSTKFTSIGRTNVLNRRVEEKKPVEEKSFTKKISSLFGNTFKSKKKISDTIINKKIKTNRQRQYKNLNTEKKIVENTNQSAEQNSIENTNQSAEQNLIENKNQSAEQNLIENTNQNISQYEEQNIIKRETLPRGEELMSEEEIISEEEKEIKIVKKKDVPSFNDVSYFSINEEEINFYNKEKKHVNVISQNGRNINLDNLSEPVKIKFFSVLEKIPHKERPVSMKTNKSIYLHKNLKRNRDLIHLDKNGERKEKIMDIISTKKKRGMRNNFQFHKLPLFSHKDTSYNPKMENSSEFKNDEKYHKLPRLSLKDTSGIITKKIKKNNLEKKILKKTQKNNFKLHKLR